MKKSTRHFRVIACTGALAAIVVPLAGTADDTKQDEKPNAPTHMTEALRATVQKVVVLPTKSPAAGSLTGSYGRDTDGLIGGADRGGRIGDGVSTEIGPVTVRFPIPILTVPGMIFGGLTGGAKRRIQDFRDELTNELAQSAGTHLTNDALASDVFWNIRNVPSLKPKVLSLETPIPADTEAILYVSLSSVGINVEEDTAIITTTAHAALRRLSDGVHIFEREISYEDSDKLQNWTKDDKAAWRAYANYARHFIGREISAQTFDQIEINHELRPTETDTVRRFKKDDWRSTTKSLTPTLAWNIELTGDNVYGAWADEIDAGAITYDVEVYDANQMVYSANTVPSTMHTVEFGIEPCKQYRWSVRPIYSVGSDIKFGEWMRSRTDEASKRGNVGRAASEAAAYIQDFASLDVKCGRR